MIALITDRTLSDVEEGNSKGVYSYSDLNRVESAVAELLPILRGLGHNIELSIKTDWNFEKTFSENWPVKKQMNRYISNIRALCLLMNISYRDLPNSMDFLNWKSANAIELALVKVANAAEAIHSTFRYSGEVFAGEE